MKLALAVLSAILAVGTAGCFHDTATRERELTRSFKVASGSVLVVDVSGGDVTVRTGPPGVVNLALRQEVRARSDRAADTAIGRYDVAMEQQGDTVTLRALRRNGGDWDWDGVQFSASVEVPADVRLDIKTSGGQVRVGGERTAAVKLRTSGGSVRVDGGSGDTDISTAGGQIAVQRALGALRARTSGGNVEVRYLTMTRDVDLATSGGSIDVGVARNAAFTFDGRSSGGNIDLRDLPTENIGDKKDDHTLNVTVNGGGARRFIARSTGGRIRVRGADDEN
jgi:hypothetical protein